MKILSPDVLYLVVYVLRIEVERSGESHRLKRCRPGLLRLGELKRGERLVETGECILAVLVKVFHFLGVYPHDAEEKVSRHSQRYGDTGVHDSQDGGGDVGGGVVRFLEAVLEVSGDPHGGEWALSRQKGLRIKHVLLLLRVR